MATCDYCGKKVNILYTCKHCKKILCKEHKLPENHECISLNQLHETETKSPNIDILPTKDYEDPTQNVLSSITPRTRIIAEMEHNRFVSEEPEKTIDITPSKITEEHKTTITEYEPQTLEPESVQIEETTEQIGIKTPHPPLRATISEFFKNLEKEENHLPVKKKLPSKPLLKLPNLEIGSITPLILLAILSLASIALNGFLYIQHDSYKENSQYEYTKLSNTTQTLNNYYENLTSLHSVLRTEYHTLNELYTNLVQENANLEQEYNDIMNYNKNINLVTKKTVIIPPKGNITEIYEIPFSGYITVNYTAIGEIYTWIGSTQLTNTYFSRNPQFPVISSTFNFTVPILPDVILYIANPDETQSIEVTYTIKYTY